MSRLDNKRQILYILSENSKKSQPQVVNSTDIAELLKMSVAETRQLIKVLNQTGVIESDQEGEYSLITPKGVHWLAEVSFSRAS